MAEWIKLAKTDEFKEIPVPFDVEGIEIMGVKIDDKYVVASRICTHKYFDLTKGHYMDGYITCTLHTSIFDLNDGTAMNPPAKDPLTIYPTKVEDGYVYIDIDV